MQMNAFICFVDFEKVFDSVKHDEMIKILKVIGVDEKDVRLINNLCWSQEAAIRVDEERTDLDEIKRGVRQGFVLLKDLFSLRSQEVMDELVGLEGISVGGRNMNNIRFVEDTV